MTRQDDDAARPGWATARRPGWPEITAGSLAGGAVLLLLPLIGPLGTLEPVGRGLLLAGWSGLVGLVGFAAAALIRLRSWSAFGVRRTSWRWLVAGAAAGVAALVLKGLVNVGLLAVTGLQDPQGSYWDAAAAGVLPLLATLALLSFLTPLGEELFFRGVVANALLRHGPAVGVFGSAAVFALFHGVNLALPSAFSSAWSQPRCCDAAEASGPPWWCTS
ncbi:CPBP family intramembrane glutamic endopeptidase [Kineococcus vitellinus]|uniref:CPBP family intramembrane glutamic endopeptidase n=1 Tax=Kineococcus vitellinus TaxID=2696565 RepID=UPI00196B8E52|nr:CPBP family intramembrane glutamic endopeptidase [Kineococcus vitellinus]